MAIERVDEITTELTDDLLQANDYWLYALKSDGTVDYKVKSSTLNPIKRYTAQTVGAVNSDKILTLPTLGGCHVRIVVSAENAAVTKGYCVEKRFKKTVVGATSTSSDGEVSDFTVAVTAAITYPSATTVQIRLTGEAAETINWTVQYEIVRS